MAGVSVTVGGNFQKLDELARKAKDVSGKIQTGFAERIGHRMFDGLIAGANQAATAIATSVRGALAQGAKLDDFAQRTGASARDLAILGHVFVNAGSSAEKVAPALNKMQQALTGVNDEGEPTNKAFEKLGLSIGELAQMDAVSAFRKIAETIAGLGSAAQRSGEAMSIFGRSGAELLVAMNDPAAWAKAEAQLGGLANTLGENAAAFAEVDESLENLNLKTQQAGAAIAASLLPELEKVTAWVAKEDFTELGDRIGAAVQSALKLGGALAKVAKLAPAYQIGRGLEWAVNNGGNLTKDEQAATIAEARKKAMDLYAAERENPSGARVDDKTAQIEAEIAHTSAVAAAEKAYEKAREAYEKYVSGIGEKSSGGGTAAEQLSGLDAAEKKIREGMNYAIRQNMPAASAADIAKALAGTSDSATRGSDMEQVRKLAELEQKRVELTQKKKQEDKDAAEKLKEAADAYNQELALLQAKISGSAEHVAQLEREAETREEIRRLTEAGMNADEARAKATALVDARKKAAEKKAEEGALGTYAEAQALVDGKDPGSAKRIEELKAQGVDPARAKDIAANESDLEKIAGLRRRMDNLGFAAPGQVSNMQRIGGGGGMSGALDYSRQQTMLQRQMVQALNDMKSRLTPSLTD